MRRAARVDATAPDLVKIARQLGAKVWLLNKEVDALMLFRGRLILVDFKTSKGKRNPKLIRTATQMQMEAAGWPIRYAATPEQVAALLTEQQPTDQLSHLLRSACVNACQARNPTGTPFRCVVCHAADRLDEACRGGRRPSRHACLSSKEPPDVP